MQVFLAIQQAGSGNGIGFALVLFFGGLLMFYSGLKKLQRDRLIANIPTSKIRSMAMGIVELYGTIQPYEETLTAPFSGKECVCIAAYQSPNGAAGGNGPTWWSTGPGKKVCCFIWKMTPARFWLTPGART